MDEHPQWEECEVGRKIGHDLFRFRRSLLDRVPASVAEGIAHARARGVARQEADRFIAKWLQLRLGALNRGRSFDERVTPDFIRGIDLDTCPVTRERLTHGLRLPTDWSIDRLNNDGAYARNNLAVMSTRANQAKGDRNFAEVLVLTRDETMRDGLAPQAWGRLASLMLGPCFVGNAKSAPLIPLTAPVTGHDARPASQVIQYVFTRRGATLPGKNALLRQFGSIGREGGTRTRLEVFAQLMLTGLKQTSPCWDVWLRPEVMAAFVAWRGSMDSRCWSLVGEVARRLADARPLGREMLETWHVAKRGFVS